MLQSTDGGASWQTLAQANVPVAWIVQTPFIAGFWHICRGYGILFAVSCSVDSGQTWTWYRLPWSPAVTPKGAPDIELPTVFAIATDGSLLAQDQLGTQDVVSLTPDSIVWQDLGPAPLVWDPFEVGPGGYAPTPSGGILWLDDGTQTAAYPPQ